MIISDIVINDAEVSAVILGHVDTAAAGQFAQELKPLIEVADHQIVLDCSGLEFISSSGLRHLLTLRKAAQTKGGQILVKGLNDNVKKVFKITGFDKLFSIS